MQFKQLDSRQVPQVVVLGVLTVGVLAYGGFSLFSAATARPAQPAAPPPAPETAPAAAQAQAVGTGAAARSAPVPPSVAALLAGSAYTPDPFRPSATARSGSRPNGDAGQALARGTRTMGAALGSALGSLFGGVARGMAGAAGTGSVAGGTGDAQAAPPPPERPDLAVTGIIDAEGGPDMALVTVGSEARILQVGDVLPGRYRVTRITLSGVQLATKDDRWFVPLGNKSDGQSGAAAARQNGARPPSAAAEPTGAAPQPGEQERAAPRPPAVPAFPVEGAAPA
jgi:hypothetical protein